MTLTASAIDLDIRPLSATIGAEIRGIDAKEPLTDSTVELLRDALLHYKVIFLPGQHLAPAEHLAFAQHFGEPTPAHPVIPGIDGYPEVFEIDYSKFTQLYETYGDVAEYDGLSWHTDVTFVERPPLGSILNAVVIPPAGGDTMFSDQIASYDDLSQPFKDLLDPLVAVHDGRERFRGALEKREGGGEWEGSVFSELVPVEHPVIRRHPESGAKSIFVNPGFTSHIKDIPRSESDAILQFLYAHTTKPKYTVRYHWSRGDLGFWDNRATQHSVVGDFTGQHRVIQRVTLRGDRPN
jgi:taurine dioxygenase